MNSKAVSDFRRNLRPIASGWSAARLKWLATKGNPSHLIALQGQLLNDQVRASGDLLRDAKTVEAHDDVVDMGSIAHVLAGLEARELVLADVRRHLDLFPEFSIQRNYVEQVFTLDQARPNLWLRSYGDIRHVDLHSMDADLARVSYHGLADATRDVLDFGIGNSLMPHVLLVAPIPIWTEASLDTGALTVRVTMRPSLDPRFAQVLYRLEKNQGRRRVGLNEARRVRDRGGVRDFEVVMESDGAKDARVWTLYEGLDEPVDELIVTQSKESGAFQLVQHTSMTAAEKRMSVLRFLRDRIPKGQALFVSDIANGIGLAEQEVDDLINILAELGAVEPNRTFGGAWPVITARGRLILEEMEERSAAANPRASSASPPQKDEPEFRWDAFIAHASEDKAPFANKLADLLRARGLEIWYDEFILKVGDSLREKIDEGLLRSRFGIVILSNAFFRKKWTRRELDGLTALERGDRKVILPVWFDVEVEHVEQYSPSLAGLKAAKANDGMEKVIEDLLRVLMPR